MLKRARRAPTGINKIFITSMFQWASEQRELLHHGNIQYDVSRVQHENTHQYLAKRHVKKVMHTRFFRTACCNALCVVRILCVPLRSTMHINQILECFHFISPRFIRPARACVYSGHFTRTRVGARIVLHCGCCLDARLKSQAFSSNSVQSYNLNVFFYSQTSFYISLTFALKTKTYK